MHTGITYCYLPHPLSTFTHYFPGPIFVLGDPFDPTPNLSPTLFSSRAMAFFPEAAVERRQFFSPVSTILLCRASPRHPVFFEHIFFSFLPLSPSDWPEFPLFRPPHWYDIPHALRIPPPKNGLSPSDGFTVSLKNSAFVSVRHRRPWFILGSPLFPQNGFTADDVETMIHEEQGPPPQILGKAFQNCLFPRFRPLSEDSRSFSKVRLDHLFLNLN